MRWVGESANSLMPAGAIGGPVLMMRQLSQRGVPMQAAAAQITVSTTFQTLAQIVFALLGLALVVARASQAMPNTRSGCRCWWPAPCWPCRSAGFYLLQRRGLFGKLHARGCARFAGKRRLV